ncbi:very short patch repair endonuclease [Thiomonas sp. FB-Cd]|uniref:very short patch repair endonuclease n=1 Tax=Thiomonas sp. FB-Cd TaxID=1158292 RepID=UPI0004DEFDE0|nr:DNA mismatch endonuclease Vsr [Thiomonas sp. FB-Cd]
MDTVSRQRRSEIMGRVRSKDTGPELIVRRLVHAMGFRYRLHGKDLPGRPDLVFRRRGKVIFVHGCFWHRHDGCVLARLPKSRTDFWLPKLEANKERDERNRRDLKRSGWKVLTVWECQLSRVELLRKKIRRFLDA